ncbi:hypothetical protein GCM10025857_13610 [Alicyclobacillus contaminans]|uniref:tetratricopeptide repeat protein n=1 Tax=Alicyclobacillus contaminans TaxID=392016 RepID=UPI000425B8AF|nr:hypothetical protein GCM10025857_13610 [Alicyclobacillus contaminans]
MRSGDISEQNWRSVVESGWQLKHEPSRLVQYFQHLVHAYPADGRATFELASALDFLGEEAQAIPLYEEAIALGLSEADEASAMLQLGSSLRNVGRFKEAVSVLQNAQQRHPGMPVISMFLALALYSNGQSDLALQVALQVMIEHLKSDDVERYRKPLENYIWELECEASSRISRKGRPNTVKLQDPMQVHIRSLRADERPPMDLLLLADPSASIVAGYVKRGSCSVAEVYGAIVGVYVLLETRPETIELVNIAVREDMRGNGETYNQSETWAIIVSEGFGHCPDHQ